MKVPCYNCKKRKLYCHSHCEAYKEYKEMTIKIRKKRHIEAKLVDHKAEAVFRTSGLGNQL